MVQSLMLNESWDMAQDVARQMHNVLGIHESDGQCMIHRVDGNMRHGWRIVVTRCADGVSRSQFVMD